MCLSGSPRFSQSVPEWLLAVQECMIDPSLPGLRHADQRGVGALKTTATG